MHLLSSSSSSSTPRLDLTIYRLQFRWSNGWSEEKGVRDRGDVASENAIHLFFPLVKRPGGSLRSNLSPLFEVEWSDD